MQYLELVFWRMWALFAGVMWVMSGLTALSHFFPILQTKVDGFWFIPSFILFWVIIFIILDEKDFLKSQKK